MYRLFCFIIAHHRLNFLFIVCISEIEIVVNCFLTNNIAFV